MKRDFHIRIFLVALCSALSFLNACQEKTETESPARLEPQPTSTAPPSLAADDSTEGTIRFLEARVKNNPDDFIAFNKLAGYYLQRQRETGDPAYINLALLAARSSLEALAPEQNHNGLAVLAQAAFTGHDFSAAREYAVRLTELAPHQSYSHQILGDALLELGDYEAAASAFKRMEQLENFPTTSTETRLARLALLRGDTETAKRRFSKALQLALGERVVRREIVAWCHWQMGETAFAVGDFVTAEQHYNDALLVFPDYYRALASLARVRAARGELTTAIENYERVARILPDPVNLAALGDLYKLMGREKEAAAHYALVENIARLSELNGALFNRQLAYFYADHDMNLEEAYAIAAREYGVRRDIYGADALAWTALKTGRLEQAQTMIREALRLGTRDARLFYHAGMIARAAGEKDSARDFLRRALKLNPGFDPMQTVVARRALEE